MGSKLALEGSDIDVLKWLRSQFFYETCVMFPKTQQEKSERVMGEGIGESTKTFSKQHRGSPKASVTDCVLQIDTGSSACFAIRCIKPEVTNQEVT